MLDNMFAERLHKYLYKTVTVHTVGSNEHALDFTGTLASIHEDYITIILTLGTVKKPEETPRNVINFNRTFHSRPVLCQPGSIADIPISKIAAIVHYPG
ncbi:hypothetical protein HZI73_12985 [Vallitalea pronyensis]|uniref:Uncharacterized protein n=1 Tax=Vallitalea pronyensis TaxID=1348613 RepID=A0A8J8MKH4_9FIRM|nr:hypothetical protein [Vallitalea pronyensis]QUI23146.1 hypothetical protein HZI73_12985 [Vallitalea pronyensis]